MSLGTEGPRSDDRTGGASDDRGVVVASVPLYAEGSCFVEKVRSLSLFVRTKRRDDPSHPRVGGPWRVSPTVRWESDLCLLRASSV